MDLEAAKAFILEKLRTELPDRRTYHSLEHTLDVYAAVIDIAARERVDAVEMQLLKTAALFHDAGFTEHDVDHEEAGCRIVRRALPGFGYAPEHVERVCALIMSTRIPHRPEDRLEEILCDADLDYLGRPDFVRIGDLLFAELRAYGVLSSELEWNRVQERFLREHRFFTATNMRDRDPLKAAHLAGLQRWLAENDPS